MAKSRSTLLTSRLSMADFALKDGGEVCSPDQLPKGAFLAMRAAADTTDVVRMVWDDTDR